MIGLFTAGRRGPAAFSRAFSAAPAAAKLDIKLYQYEICPFCCKVKAYLDWKGIPYNTKDVNPLSKAEIKFSPQYKKVPIAFIDGEQVNDSDLILESVVENLRKDGILTDTEAKEFQDADAKKWRDWATKDLAVLLFPNLTRNFKESLEAFGYIDKIPHLSPVQKFTNRILGGVAMRLANGKIKKKYNIEDERKALLDCWKSWQNLQNRIEIHDFYETFAQISIFLLPKIFSF